MELDGIVEKVLGNIFVELEASGRHVHVTEAQAQVLFGHRLTEKRPPLSAAWRRAALQAPYFFIAMAGT